MSIKCESYLQDLCCLVEIDAVLFSFMLSCFNSCCFAFIHAVLFWLMLSCFDSCCFVSSCLFLIHDVLFWFMFCLNVCCRWLCRGVYIPCPQVRTNQPVPCVLLHAMWGPDRDRGDYSHWYRASGLQADAEVGIRYIVLYLFVLISFIRILTRKATGFNILVVIKWQPVIKMPDNVMTKGTLVRYLRNQE